MKTTNINQNWESEMDQISKEMIEYAKNYKCKTCKEQPEDHWCKHLIRARDRRFITRIKVADARESVFGNFIERDVLNIGMKSMLLQMAIL